MKSIIVFFILLISCSQNSERFSISKGDSQTTIFWGEHPVLSYVHQETMPPEGIDPLYKRSAYIHPLWSPGGEILTRIQPPDHYHHYGIWNPWTRTRFDDREVDFWNLAEGQGTVRFAEYLDLEEAADHAKIRVRQDHIYFLEDGSEEVAINEIWEVKVQTSADHQYIVDFTSILNTPLDGGILLEAYRYGGGLGYRATERWNTDNSTVLTSEGLTRKDADASNARWVIVEGESSVPEGRSGILFLSHPSNRAHPEPMRVWPPDAQGGIGNVYFEFCPIRHQEWKLEQGKDYFLKYRMVVFDGKMDTGSAEQLWTDFAKE